MADAGRWDDLREGGMVRSLAPGDVLFRQGDPADAAYVLLSGHCVVLEGDEHVNVLWPGELFGEIGALAGGVRTATVRAVEVSELLCLSTSQLRAGITRSPDLFWQALRLIVDRLQLITTRQLALREEHHALREVQRSLLPDLSRPLPPSGLRIDAVWEPCTYASGDYYDVVELDPHRHLIALGDVMGHGAEASLMMAVARAQIRELARSFRRTDELVLRLDGYLRDNAPPRQGMSLFVAVYDHRERVLEYSSAGHPFPLWWHGGEPTDLPGRPGLLLALPFLVSGGYERREIELSPGDRLLLFTDGLFEVSVDADGTQLGRAGLARLLHEVLTVEADPLAALLARVAELDVLDAADDDRTALLVSVPPIS